MTTREKSKPSIMSKKPPNPKSEGKHRSGYIRSPTEGWRTSKEKGRKESV
jgi:hypothetical protein